MADDDDLETEIEDDELEPEPDPDATGKRPARLGPGGRALWAAMYSEGMSEHLVALLTEACRARDRLDGFDMVLSGDVETWLYLFFNEDDVEYHVNVSNVLAAANQTAGVLRLLLAQIPPPAVQPTPAAGGKTPTSPLDQLQARREAKGGGAGDGLTTRARTAARRRRK